MKPAPMGDLASESERVLVERARSGDRTSMKRIYDCYSKYLAATCSRFLPDRDELRDVLQDSFVKVFSSLDRFEYRGAGSLKAWMRQIAVNESLKFLRNRRRHGTVEYQWELPDVVEDDPEGEMDVGNIPPEVIQAMVKDLPEGYRTVLNLYVFEGWSHRRISAELGITEGTSASQLHRARAILAKKIEQFRNRRNDG